MNQSWQQTICAQQQDGTALTASTTSTSLLHATGKAVPLAPGQLAIGSTIRVRAAGRISTVVTTPGTLTLDIRFVSSAGTVVVFNGGAMALNIVAKTNVAWVLEGDLVVRAVGSGTAANLIGVLTFMSEAVIGAPVPGTGGSGVLLLPSSAPAVGTGFDYTLAQTADLFGTWSLNNADSILVHTFSVESKN